MSGTLSSTNPINDTRPSDLTEQVTDLQLEEQINNHIRSEDFKDFKQSSLKFIIKRLIPGLAIAWGVCSLIKANTSFNVAELQEQIGSILMCLISAFGGVLFEKYIKN